jgi:phospholipid/cholesterol/gamma-HCH transport system permease protein
MKPRVAIFVPRRLWEALAAFGEAVEFCKLALRGIWRGRVFSYFSEVLRQASLLVTGSLVVVLGLVFALGLALGIESVYGSNQIGTPSAAGAFTALGGLRELIPYAFGYMMAAKVSTGYVAELGTMGISDEIDALDVMGLDSLAYLASTRVLGTWLVLPFMYAIAVVVGFIASFISCVVQLGEVSAGGYLELFWKFQTPTDYLFSGLKGMAMATFVVLVGCFFGYTVRGGPVDVGRATARAMVINLIGIHVIGILGSQLFWGGAPRVAIGG